MVIRPYRPDDLTAVVALFHAAVHGLGSAHYDASQLAAWAPDTPDMPAWAERLSAETVLVAEHAGTIAGFIAFREDGYIDMLFVHPDYARIGVASELHAAAETQPGRTKALHTHASLTARPFFESRGYRVTEEETVFRAGIALKRYAMHKQGT